MQNNENKKIENQGWKQMQQILDQELPVQKSKRRIVPWFWLSGVAAIFVLAAAMLFMNHDQNHQDDQSIASDKLIEVTDSGTKINKEEKFEISAEKEVSNKAIASQKAEVPNELVHEQKKGILNIEIINPTAISTEVIEPIQNQTSPNSIDQKIINQYEHFKSQNLSITCPSPSVLPTVKKAQIQKDLEKLPLRYTDLVYDSSEKPVMESANLKTIEPLKERKAKAQWAMNIGALSATQPRIHGASTGLEVQFPLSKKWSLKTGLNYRIVNLNKVFVNIDGTKNVTNTLDDVLGVGLGNDTLAPSGISSFELDASTYNNRTQNFEFRISDNYHFVSIPVEAHFQLKSHGIWAGTKTSYLLNADQQNSAADLRWASQDNDPNLSYNNNSAPAVPRFDIGLTIGYEYNLNQKIGLNLSYHHGNLLQQNNWHLDNRFFKLGANYSL